MAHDPAGVFGRAFGYGVAVTRAHGLADEEYAALRQLQQGAAAPPAEDPIWAYLLAVGLVWIDWEVRPPMVHLTAGGRVYPTDQVAQ
jgi:hypothetical protein